MSEIPAVARSAELRLPPDSQEAPKRDKRDKPRPRHDGKAQAADTEVSEPVEHKLNVNA